MKITISQLRRIIKEETQNVITESSKLPELEFNSFEDSELWQNTAEFAIFITFAKAYSGSSSFAAAILGVTDGSFPSCAWDENERRGFKRTSDPQKLHLKNSSGGPWRLTLTLGTLNGETVVRVHDKDSGEGYYFKYEQPT